MNNRLLATLALGACALSLAACATSRVDANFGDAVEANLEAQLYDRDAAMNPSLDPVEGTDGQRMETVMEAHRGQAGDAQSVSNPIVINVGQ